MIRKASRLYLWSFQFMDKKIKLGILKGTVYFLTFLVALVLISHMINRGNADMTAQMADATFPTVAFLLNGDSINTLHGYSEERDCKLQRDTIQPVQMDRKLQFEINKYGQTIAKVSYQVRSVDGERLIEDHELEDYQETKEQIYGFITLKDLIEADQEYELVLQVLLENGQNVWFYTRLIQSENNHAAEKAAFVRDFHEKTFDKEAAEELAVYLEPDSSGDNTTLGYANIHSSLSQITWAELQPKQVTPAQVTIRELEQQTGSFQITYLLAIPEGRQNKYYRVEESYRIRYTKDRIYLLDFERTMEQYFDETANIYNSNKIELGIRQEAAQLVEDDGGSVVAFVTGGALYCYQTTDEKIAVLFRFTDQKHWDERTIYRQYGIRILNVDEGGNVQFMVYGYMNRGKHEGQVGIVVYGYNASLNTVEELLYIPYDKTYEVLEAEIDRLTYLSKSNDFFFTMQDTVYTVNLENRQLTVVVKGLQGDTYDVSKSNRMFVWQELKNGTPSALILKNLTTMEEHRIEAGEGRVIIPLGFMEEDLIYGLAWESDAIVEPSGSKTWLLHELFIENENHEVLKTYSQEGYYITDATVEDNQIVLKRVVKTEDGWEDAEDTQIMSSEEARQLVNVQESVVTEKYQKIYQIALKDPIADRAVKVLTPKEVIFEGSKQLDIVENEETEHYYVYALGKVLGIYVQPEPAVKQAYENAGIVLAEDGSYIWKRTTRSVKNQIMAIKGGIAATEEKTRVAVCLDAMLEFAGVPRQTQYMLQQGELPFDILKKVLEQERVLDLSGNTLDALLYYVNMDDPVLAISRKTSEAYLIIGFNEFNIVVMDPADGTVYKKGMNDSKSLFENGNWQFLTYLPK